MIAAVAEAGSTGGGSVYDPSGATLLPGLIDTHVLIAVAGDPTADIRSIERVVFVMRAGRVCRYDP